MRRALTSLAVFVFAGIIYLSLFAVFVVMHHSQQSSILAVKHPYFMVY